MPRLSLGRSGLIAAAAVAGAVVYWRASVRQRSRDLAEIDEAVAEGRDAAQRLLGDSEAVDPPFDQTS
jgi:cytidylate kinase